MQPSAVPDLSALPQGKDDPVFAEPWQAHAFALAVRLADAGRFSSSEWAAALGEEIRAAQERGDPDRGPTYYQHWLNALERLCVAKGLVSDVGLRQRKEQWRQAYLHTPHGQPVELSAAEPVPPHS
jgi:nitrile hydratase accessory protein